MSQVIFHALKTVLYALIERGYGNSTNKRRELGGTRNKTAPQVAGKPALNASLPQSLSKVSGNHSSACARAKTCPSLMPGQAVPTHFTSCPSLLQILYSFFGEIFISDKTHSQIWRG